MTIQLVTHGNTYSYTLNTHISRNLIINVCTGHHQNYIKTYI